MKFEILEPFRYAAIVAEEIAFAINELCEEKEGEIVVALAGGKTPGKVYRTLGVAQSRNVPWERVRFFLSDERLVPLHDSQSNYRMVQETLLHYLSADSAGTPLKIEAIKIGDESPSMDKCQLIARDYSDTLAKTLNGAPIDLLLLGMGEDGHTASLFPGDVLLEDSVLQHDMPYYVPTQNPTDESLRISLSPQAITTAKKIFFLITGASKSSVVARAFNSNEGIMKLPARIATLATGSVMWFLDSESGQNLRGLKA
jgi:6-phosphogluconolactonase